MGKILLMVAGGIAAYIASGYLEGLIYGNDATESTNDNAGAIPETGGA